MKRITSWVFIIVLMFYMATAAYAVPVGVFSWGESVFGEPVFMVENCSPTPYVYPCEDSSPSVSFFDVFVELTIGDVSVGQYVDILDSMSSAPIGPSEVAQSIEDLAGLNILQAALRFEFRSVLPDVTLPGTMRLVDADGNPVVFLDSAGTSVLIDYEPAGGQVPVPEPATLLLVGGGLAGLILWRRRTGRYS